MKPHEILKTAITNNFRSKLRTSLTILAIFVGAFTLTITNGLGTGISNYIDSQIAAVGSSNSFTVSKTDTSGNPGSGPKKHGAGTRVLAAGGPPGSTQQALGQADLNTIGAIPGITGVTVLRLSPDYIQWNGHDKYQLSVSPPRRSPAPARGRHTPGRCRHRTAAHPSRQLRGTPGLRRQ
jgi:putative ABC transport system permease protein